MKSLPYDNIVKTVRQLCVECCYKLPDDVLGALKKAQQNETNPQGKKIIGQLIENAKIAAEQERIFGENIEPVPWIRRRLSQHLF